MSKCTDKKVQSRSPDFLEETVPELQAGTLALGTPDLDQQLPKSQCGCNAIDSGSADKSRSERAGALDLDATWEIPISNQVTDYVCGTVVVPSVDNGPEGASRVPDEVRLPPGWEGWNYEVGDGDRYGRELAGR